MLVCLSYRQAAKSGQVGVETLGDGPRFPSVPRVMKVFAPDHPVFIEPWTGLGWRERRQACVLDCLHAHFLTVC